MLTVDPLVAVTSTVEVPIGVPGFGGGKWLPPLLLPPPPQLGATTSNSRVSSKNNPRTLCRFPPTRTVEARSSPIPAVHWPGKYGRCCELAVGAVVVIAIATLVVFAVPVVVIVAGPNTQAAFEGRPEQAKLIVPLNPVEFEMLIEVLPVSPGVEINTVDCAAGMVP